MRDVCKSEHPQPEKSVFTWFKRCRDKNVRLFESVVSEKAENIAFKNQESISSAEAMVGWKISKYGAKLASELFWNKVSQWKM